MKLSIREYESGRKLLMAAHEGVGNPFYSLLQACFRCAGSDNLAKLQTLFPEEYNELQARYNAPGGILNTDA